MIEGDLFAQNDRGKTDMKTLITGYARYWYLFAIAVAIPVTIAFFKIRYTVPLHHVGCTILLKDPADNTGFSANPALSDLEMLKSSKNMDDQIMLLKSKTLMQRVLTELSLHTTYFLEGTVHDIEVAEADLPIKIVVSRMEPNGFGKKVAIYPKDNNTFLLEEADAAGKPTTRKFGFGDQIKRPYAEFTVLEASSSASYGQDEKIIVQFQDIAKLSSHYSNQLSISPANKTSNVLSIGLTDPVWKRSILIMNKLIEVYETEAAEDKNLTASNALTFMDDRLKFLTTELSDVEKNVELYKKMNDLTDVSSEAQLYLQSADDYGKKLAEFDIQIEILNSLDDYLKREGSDVELVPSSLSIADPTLVVLIGKFNELQLEKQRMLRTTRPDNPLIQNINDQLKNLRTTIGENIKNIRNGLVITRQNLVASSRKFEHRKKKVPAMERELLEINRQQGVKEALYLYLLQKREESALSLAASVSSFRVVDPPAVLYPILPNKPMIYMIAVLLGMTFAFAIVYIRNLLNDKVMGLEDIKALTKVPILGEIVRSKSKDTIVVGHLETTLIAEMFRLIRTNHQFYMLGKPNVVTLITSSMSGEGKSFFSLNLAASLVLTGKKVVVLGMDLRRPTLLQSVKMAEGLGITNFLVSASLTVEEIIRPSDVLPDLYIISSGPVLPSPTELMMSRRAEELFTRLKGMFDHIIIDSAPIGLVADAFTLAQYLDSTIYLVRRDYTPKGRLELIDQVHRENKLRNPMIVLNDTEIRNGKGYGYGYGYGNSSDKKKKKKAVNGKPANGVEVVNMN
jgi:tyrosine-protein kinase Etk/Wzc